MGVITLALIAHGTLDADDFSVPLWVKLAAATGDRRCGTCFGGWRIIDTMGNKITQDRGAAGLRAPSRRRPR